MNSNFVTSHVLFDEYCRALDNARAHNKEGGCELLGREVVQEFPGMELERTFTLKCLLTGLNEGKNKYITEPYRKRDITDCNGRDHRQS